MDQVGCRHLLRRSPVTAFEMNTTAMKNLSQSVSFTEGLGYWLKLGFISFGGPAGQTSVMQQKLVENKRYSEHRPCMLWKIDRSASAPTRRSPRLAPLSRTMSIILPDTSFLTRDSQIASDSRIYREGEVSLSD